MRIVIKKFFFSIRCVFKEAKAFIELLARVVLLPITPPCGLWIEAEVVLWLSRPYVSTSYYPLCKMSSLQAFKMTGLSAEEEQAKQVEMFKVRSLSRHGNIQKTR